MEHLFIIENEEHLIWLARRGNVFQLSHRGVESPVSLDQCSEHIYRLRVGQASDVMTLAVKDDTFYVHLNGETHALVFRNPISRFKQESAEAAGDIVRAPMPGTVVQLPVQPGDPVNVGDAVVVIESMKLEMVLRAPRAGTIMSLSIAAGSKFERDAILVSLEPRAEA
jgi:biotin carboxyl carrier protein